MNAVQYFGASLLVLAWCAALIITAGRSGWSFALVACGLGVFGAAAAGVVAGSLVRVFA